MSLTYAQYVTALSTLLVIPETNSDFLAILPDCIDYTENRMQRELDFLQTVVRDSSQTFTPNSRNFSLPTAQGTFVVVNGINVITPAGTSADSGTRNQLVPVSRDFLDLSWPSVTGATLPTYFAMLTQGTILVGPWPDAAYVVEVVGTQRFTPLSSTNTSNFISINLPDLYLAASMIYMSGYTRNFGSQADDPKMAQSWSSQYDALMASAAVEEARKRFAGSAWSSLTQSPTAQPARN